MLVFKTYFKVLKSIFFSIMIYVVLFFGMSVMFTFSSEDTIKFEAFKPDITLINYDNETELVKSFRKYLETNTNIINIKDDEESLSDALFYRKVTYIIKVPKNFTKDFMNNKDVKLDIKNIPSDSSTVYTDMLINKYFNLAKIYVKSNIDEKTLGEKILINLEKETPINIINTNKETGLEGANYYFNYMSYVLLAILILVIGMGLSTFNNINIKRRNLCSPLSKYQINIQLILSSLVISTLIWVVFSSGGVILYGSKIFTTNGLLLLLNSFIFMNVALSIGFLVGMLVKSREGQSALSNVIALGSSFLSGAFVPQMFLSKSVLLMASVLPSYWFIKANNLICTNSLITSSIYDKILISFIVQVGMAVVIYVVTMIITKLRKQVI